MTRPLRIEYSGAVYHVTSRGNAQHEIYLDDEDRLRFLKTFQQVKDRFNWLCYAYCLMPNHYHLLIETVDPTLSRGMRHLNGVYTQTFNQRHRRSGHVFQGRFKAILVERDAYLLELSRYIVLNPVRAKMVQTAKDWPWSSYCATAGVSESTGLVSTDYLLEQFGRDRRRAQRGYRQFVGQGRGLSPWEQVKGQIYLGSESFIASLPKKDDTICEIPKMQRFADRPALDEIFSAGKSVEAIYQAYRDCGYTQREIAEYLGVHYATISRRIRKREEVLGNRENVDLQDLTLR